MTLKPFTQYECATGEVGRGHSTLYSGARSSETEGPGDCLCGQPLVEVADDGYRYKVMFETINPHDAAQLEAGYGREVWPTLNGDAWGTLGWMPVTNDQGTPNMLREQYRNLLRWAESREQPIRNVRLLRSRGGEWEEVPT